MKCDSRHRACRRSLGASGGQVKLASHSRTAGPLACPSHTVSCSTLILARKSCSTLCVTALLCVHPRPPSGRPLLFTLTCSPGQSPPRMAEAAFPPHGLGQFRHLLPPDAG